jgi:hypothetical protein
MRMNARRDGRPTRTDSDGREKEEIRDKPNK